MGSRIIHRVVEDAAARAVERVAGMALNQTVFGAVDRPLLNAVSVTMWYAVQSTDEEVPIGWCTWACEENVT